MIKTIFFLLTAAIVFTACGHYHDEPTKSVWAGGLWIVPWMTFIGALIFFYKAYASSKSNSTTQTPYGGPTIDNTGNVPIYKLGYFWFGVSLVVATIVIIIAVNAAR